MKKKHFKKYKFLFLGTTTTRWRDSPHQEDWMVLLFQQWRRQEEYSQDQLEQSWCLFTPKHLQNSDAAANLKLDLVMSIKFQEKNHYKMWMFDFQW